MRDVARNDKEEPKATEFRIEKLPALPTLRTDRQLPNARQSNRDIVLENCVGTAMETPVEDMATFPRATDRQLPMRTALRTDIVDAMWMKPNVEVFIPECHCRRRLTALPM
jgi:hypothetical protein